MIDKAALAIVTLTVLALMLHYYFECIVYTQPAPSSLKTTHVFYPNGTVLVTSLENSNTYVYIMCVNGTLVRRG